MGLMLWVEDLEAVALLFSEDLLWVVAEHRGLVSECSDLLQESELWVFCRTQRKIPFRVDALGRRFWRSSPRFLRRSLVGVCKTSRIRFRMQ